MPLSLELKHEVCRILIAMKSIEATEQDVEHLDALVRSNEEIAAYATRILQLQDSLGRYFQQSTPKSVPSFKGRPRISPPFCRSMFDPVD